MLTKAHTNMCVNISYLAIIYPQLCGQNRRYCWQCGYNLFLTPLAVQPGLRVMRQPPVGVPSTYSIPQSETLSAGAYSHALVTPVGKMVAFVSFFLSLHNFLKIKQFPNWIQGDTVIILIPLGSSQWQVEIWRTVAWIDCRRRSYE